MSRADKMRAEAEEREKSERAAKDLLNTKMSNDEKVKAFDSCIAPLAEEYLR